MHFQEETHEHAHVHSHTHDGIHYHEHVHTHTHSHGEAHIEGHTHEHAHDHTDEHSHDHIHGIDPRDELTALLSYMLDHNTSHTNELVELAAKADNVGAHPATVKIEAAIEHFKLGNTQLNTALKSMK